MSLINYRKEDQAKRRKKREAKIKLSFDFGEDAEDDIDDTGKEGSPNGTSAENGDNENNSSTNGNMIESLSFLLL